jgi:tRNA U34 2-thiouridine synthase MnmA/TrmU
VVKKNLKRNILFVSHGYDPEKVYKDHVTMNDFHFITDNPFENELLDFAGVLRGLLEKCQEETI